MGATVPGQVRDPARLEAVRATGLLDTPAEEAFDRLARLAAMVLRTPFAFVTLVDARRSFWKSCIGVESTDPADRQIPVEESFCQYVIASGERLVVEDAAWDDRTRTNPSVERHGVAAWAGFPVHGPDGHVLGSFCVVDTIPRQWSDVDVEVLATLAAAATGEFALRAALAEARRQSARLGDPGEGVAPLTRALQDALLPPEAPVIPGLDVGAVHTAGSTGNGLLCDLYDVFQVGADRWDVLVADVCGHGAEAARLANLTRHAARSAAAADGSPSDVLRAVHAAVLRAHERGDTLVSVVHAELQRTGTGADVTLASGGHPPALLRRAGGATSVLEGGASPLGAIGDVHPREVRLALAPGDALVLYTDGVVFGEGEAEPFGLVRLRAAVEACEAGAQELAECAATAATRWSGRSSEDDVAVVVVRVPPVDSDGEQDAAPDRRDEPTG